VPGVRVCATDKPKSSGAANLRSMHWTVRRGFLIGYAALGPCVLILLCLAARGGPRGYLLFRIPNFDWACFAAIFITGSASAYFGLEGTVRARLFQTAVYVLLIAPVSVVLGVLFAIAVFFPNG
jgi:ABC-type phosphate transport system permease subunit